MNRNLSRGPTAAFFCAVALLGGTPAAAAERVWTGAGSTANWSEFANWSGGARPVNTDTVVIPPSSKGASRNDLPGLQLNGLEFRNSTHSLTGSPLRSSTVGASGDAANVIVGLDLTIDGLAEICTCGYGGTDATQARLEFAAGTTLTVERGAWFYTHAASVIKFAGRIVESAPSNITFQGNVEFSGTSQVTGNIWVRSAHFDRTGFLRLRGGSLGSPAKVEIDTVELIIENPGAAELVVDLPLSAWSEALVHLTGAGPIRLRGTIDGRPQIEADVDVAIESRITGESVLVSAGAGLVTLRNPGNAFTKHIQVLGKLGLDTAGTIPDQATLSIVSGGELFLATHETVAEFSCNTGVIHVLLTQGRISAARAGQAGCGLQLVAPAGFAPAAGSIIPVMDSGSAIPSGPFSGLPEGAPVQLGGVDLRATYVALGGHTFAMVVAAGGERPTLLAVDASPISVIGSGDFGGVRVRAVNVKGAPLGQSPVSWRMDGACGHWKAAASGQADQEGFATMPLYVLDNVSTRCVLVASLDATGDQVSFEIFLHRSSDVQLVVSPTEVIVGLGEAFDVTARLVSTVGLPLPNFPLQLYADRTDVRLLPSGALTQGPDNSITVHVIGIGEPANYSIHVGTYTGLGKVVNVHQRAEPAYTSLQAPLQDMWWAGSAENGWGVSIIQHRDILFVVVYAYDNSGRPTWYVMPAGTWQTSSPASYAGPLYSPRGTPYYAYDAAALVAGTPIGQMTLTLRGPNELQLQVFFADNSFVFKTLTRQAFGPRVFETRPAVGDMWWGGTSQNGWGIAVLKQYENLFSVWFTYGADGLPTWFVMPAGTWSSPTTYEGSMYRTLGASWRAYNPAALQALPVGTFRFRFTDGGAIFDYTNDGRAGSLPLVRQLF